MRKEKNSDRKYTQNFQPPSSMIERQKIAEKNIDIQLNELLSDESRLSLLLQFKTKYFKDNLMKKYIIDKIDDLGYKFIEGTWQKV